MQDLTAMTKFIRANLGDPVDKPGQQDAMVQHCVVYYLCSLLSVLCIVAPPCVECCLLQQCAECIICSSVLSVLLPHHVFKNRHVVRNT